MFRNDNGDLDALPLIGLMVGFLVVGVIGIYVGDSLMTAANLNGLNPNSPLNAATANITQTFEMGVTLCKIIVIVSVAAIVFVLLGRTGLIPTFDEPRGGSRAYGGGGYETVRSQTSGQTPQRQATLHSNVITDNGAQGRQQNQQQSAAVKQPVTTNNENHEKGHTPTRWESLDIVQDSDK